MVSMTKTTNTSSDGENSKSSSSCSRGHWRPGEDEKLRLLVQQHGPQNWNSIAEKLPGRSGKSCRLRWFNQLDPRINKRPFTAAEEEQLLEAHAVHGNRWALICRLFPGRTDNAVKNHWHVVMARHHRHRHRLLAAADASFRLPASTPHQPFRYLRFGDPPPATVAVSFCFALSKSGGFCRTSTMASSTCTHLRGHSNASDVDRREALTLPLSMAFSSSGEAAPFDLDHGGNRHRDHEGDRDGDYRERKDVPYFDFLGVGVSS